MEAYSWLKTNLAKEIYNIPGNPHPEKPRRTKTTDDFKAARLGENSRPKPGQQTLLMPNGDKYIGKLIGGRVQGKGTVLYTTFIVDFWKLVIGHRLHVIPQNKPQGRMGTVKENYWGTMECPRVYIWGFNSRKDVMCHP